MIRRLTILALSLLLVAVLAAWIAGRPTSQYRSHDIGQRIRLESSLDGSAAYLTLANGDVLCLGSGDGKLIVHLESSLPLNASLPSRKLDLGVVSYSQTSSTPVLLPRSFRQLGLPPPQNPGTITFPSTVYRSIRVRAWFLLALVATYPAIAVVRFMRKRFRESNHCRNCGYDLTGNVTGRCSECGAEVESR